jgi:hypothetical protein
VTGWKKTVTAALIVITATLAGASALLVAPADHAGAAGVSSLSSRLAHARHKLRDARTDLRAARLAYQQAAQTKQASPSPTPPPAVAADATAAPSASPAPSPTTGDTPSPPTPVTLAALKTAIAKDVRRVHRLRTLVGTLQRRLMFARAAAQQQWMPIIRDAARQNHLSATGLYKLMKLESGGRSYASSGPYCGLFQYCSSTWRAAWNPWRGSSLFDGEAQIRATALAIRRGWGPGMWPNTYPRAF